MYNSYKHLFKIKWKIYNLGNFALPRPMPLDVPALFILFIGPSLLLGKLLSPILNHSYTTLGLLFNCIITYAVRQYDPQGRFILVFAYDFFIYLFRPKKVDLTGNIIQERRALKIFWDSMDLE